MNFRIFVFSLYISMALCFVLNLKSSRVSFLGNVLKDLQAKEKNVCISLIIACNHYLTVVATMTGGTGKWLKKKFPHLLGSSYILSKQLFPVTGKIFCSSFDHFRGFLRQLTCLTPSGYCLKSLEVNYVMP